MPSSNLDSYQFQVRAKNGVGSGAWSSSYTWRRPTASTPPSKPVITRVYKINGRTGLYIDISVTTVSDITNRVVRDGRNNFIASSVYDDFDSSGNGTLHINKPNTESLNVKVQLQNQHGWSPFSDIFRYSPPTNTDPAPPTPTPPTPTKPATPVITSATLSGGNYLRVNATCSTTGTLHWYRREVGGSSRFLSVSRSPVTRSFYIGSSSSYSFQIRVRKDGVYSDWSSAYTYTRPQSDPPGKPALGQIITNTSDDRYIGVLGSVDPGSSDITGFQYKTSGGWRSISSSRWRINSTNTFSLKIYVGTANSASIRVRARNSAGYGPQSDSKTWTR